MAEQRDRTPDAAEDEGAVGRSAAADEDAIRMRAWEISRREDAGSPEENWQRAIDALRAEGEPAAGS
jgi:hypothetical protein